MKRAELIRIVDDTARTASIPIPMREQLVKAVSDPSVKRVARGDWRQYNGGECFCPAALAGLATPTGPKSTMSPLEWAAVERFANSFDVATRDITQWDTVIEVTD